MTDGRKPSATTDSADGATTGASLGKTARDSLLYGAGFHLARDVAQFATMLVLVRILSPDDYGTAALSQAILSVASVVSFNTISTHALQSRDPSQVDWQAHFTAASFLNAFLFMATLLVAGLLAITQKLSSLTLPLAVLALTFLVEIPATVRHRMLETQHSWARYRVLVMLGTLLGLGCGLVIGIAGGGVWALIIQPILFGVPAAIDLFTTGRFRPDWSWSKERYRETIQFGMNRILAAAVGRGRGLVEQATLSATFDLGTLGFFTRANGLGTLLAGRFGEMAMSALYPIVTRAESKSLRFQRLAGLSLRGVVWVSAPAVALLVIAPGDIVALLYGPKWEAVTPLLPLSAVAVFLASIILTLVRLLLANEATRQALLIEVIAGVAAVVLAVTVMPFGAKTYLASLCVLWLPFLLISIWMLVRGNGVTRTDAMAAIFPGILCSAMGALAASSVASWLDGAPVVVRLAATASVLAFIYLALLRAIFPGALMKLLEVVPCGTFLMSCLGLRLVRI